MSEEPMLDIKEVSKSYANHKALDKVSMSIKKQSIFGLLGPNGAGKTSLIRIINQITAPDSGEIYFDGNKLKAADVANIGYLPEERGLYPKMKVGEQAIYLARLKGMTKKEAESKLIDWFKKFNLEKWWDKKVQELSKGMAQKVQFIVTVLHEPKLLILDEPFSGFDPINTNLIKSEIQQLRDNGTTVIFSTHNMASVEEICDSIALINNSKTILKGKIKDIKDTYKNNLFDIEFTNGNMIGFSNALWTGFELLDKKEEDKITTIRVKALEGNKINQLLTAVLKYIDIISVNEVLPSMNDIFIQKVQELEQTTDE